MSNVFLQQASYKFKNVVRDACTHSLQKVTVAMSAIRQVMTRCEVLHVFGHRLVGHAYLMRRQHVEGRKEGRAACCWCCCYATSPQIRPRAVCARAIFFLVLSLSCFSNPPEILSPLQPSDSLCASLLA